LFVVSLIRKILGEKLETLTTRKALLSEDIEIPISQREHYMRAFTYQKAATQYVKPLSKQDSSLHSVLIKSNCLLIIPPGSSSKFKDQIVDIIDI
jgi:molybdopterin biosynthesis enzyme